MEKQTITISSSLKFYDDILKYKNKFENKNYNVNVPFKEMGIYHQDIKKFNTYYKQIRYIVYIK